MDDHDLVFFLTLKLDLISYREVQNLGYPFSIQVMDDHEHGLVLEQPWWLGVPPLTLQIAGPAPLAPHWGPERPWRCTMTTGHWVRKKIAEIMHIYIISDWWFGTFFIFPYIGNNHPIWLYFSGGLKPPTSIYIHIYIYNIMNVMDMMEYDGYNGYNIWTNSTTYTHPYLRDFEILMLSSIWPPNFLRRCWKRSLHEEWHISQIWFKRNLPRFPHEESCACPLEILFLAWWNHRIPLCCWSTCAVSTTVQVVLIVADQS